MGQLAGSRRFTRQSAPILHISALVPADAAGTKVLFDRMNEQDASKAQEITELKASVDSANASISRLEDNQLTLQRGVDDYYAGNVNQPDIAAGTTVPVPPPGEPGPGPGPPLCPGAGAPGLRAADGRAVLTNWRGQRLDDLAAASWRAAEHRHALGRNKNTSGAISRDKLAYYYGDDSAPREARSMSTFDLIGSLGTSNNWQYTLVQTGRGAT
jgi:hypothetical protein